MKIKRLLRALGMFSTVILTLAAVICAVLFIPLRIYVTIILIGLAWLCWWLADDE